MNAREVIGEVNTLSPNHYDDEQKRRWLCDLDGRIEKELGMDAACFAFPLRGRQDAPRKPDEKGKTDANGDEEAALLVPAPWARDVYVNYLRARIAEADAEAERYNLYAAGYNSAYMEFAAWFIRTRQHPERGTKKGWVF